MNSKFLKSLRLVGRNNDIKLRSSSVFYCKQKSTVSFWKCLNYIAKAGLNKLMLNFSVVVVIILVSISDIVTKDMQ